MPSFSSHQIQSLYVLFTCSNDLRKMDCSDFVLYGYLLDCLRYTTSVSPRNYGGVATNVALLRCKKFIKMISN